MSKQKPTKEQRASRENSLVSAIVAGLVATLETQAKAWAYRARDLRKGLSTTAIKRAEREAHKLADERPPGYVKAMEAMDIAERVFRQYRLPKRAQNDLWAAIVQFCMFQLAAKEGPFYEAAHYFGMIAAEYQQREAIPVVRAARTPGCNCPNCRPRTAEELN